MVCNMDVVFYNEIPTNGFENKKIDLLLRVYSDEETSPLFFLAQSASKEMY